MQRSHIRWMTFMLLAGMLCLPVSVFAAGPLGEAVATLSAGSASVDWLPLGSAERLVLTVSRPDGVVVRREFKAGENPTFGLFDAKGNRLADGAYTWELRAVPQIDKATREALRAARAAGNDAAVTAELKKAGRLPEERVQSGSFTVQGGAVLAGDAAEPRSERPVDKRQQDPNPTRPVDQVIPDDLVVQGSGCFGFDCVNNESFGFDTIRLKENNLRIKFEDTSVGSFPTNDWQLTANDSASGGANKFSIEDITGAKVPFTVTAGAATNSIFVDSTGRVGLRTATPVLDVHISTSNTPAIRLEQTNAGGFTAQTWDVAGNEANFFVRDVTGGSRLPFRIRPGAPTSSIDISADGDVGIGTASPSNKLHVTSSAGTAKLLVSETNGTTTPRELMELNNNGGAVLVLRDASVTQRWAIGTVGSTLVIDNQANAGTEFTLGPTGNLTLSGSVTATVKNFAAVDPADPTKKIHYVSLEGPEAGTYYRGTAKTVNGEAVIDLPGHFARLTDSKGMTVQLTPVGAWGQLYVASKASDRLVIRVPEGAPDMEFDYLVQGSRVGYENYEVVRDIEQ